jgi:glycosyltransferase involved in cell wall biosynthesis
MDILALSTASVTAINRTIYSEMKNRGWRIELVIPKLFPVTSSKQLNAETARPIDPPIHVLELKGGNPRTFYFPELMRLVKERKPKVIIMESDPVSFMAVHTGRLCKKYDIFLFCLSCENLSFDILPTLYRRGIASVPSSLLKKAFFLLARPTIHTVFTINNDGAELFRRKGFSHVIKIPLGFDPVLFRKDDLARDRIRETLHFQFPVIGYFGRIVPEKGVDILLRALATLKHLNWHFMLDRFNTYENPYHKHIQGLIISLGMEDRVTSIDADHYEISSFMNAADVVVIPSLSTSKWREQYGRVAPEAMACGKVVIAARSGALPELIGDAGLLFEEGNSVELADLLSSYLAAPVKYELLSLKAADRAYNLFSTKKQADIYEECIIQVGVTSPAQ